jgi:hypothetical protein
MVTVIDHLKFNVKSLEYSKSLYSVFGLKIISITETTPPSHSSLLKDRLMNHLPYIRLQEKSDVQIGNVSN